MNFKNNNRSFNKDKDNKFSGRRFDGEKSNRFSNSRQYKNRDDKPSYQVNKERSTSYSSDRKDNNLNSSRPYQEKSENQFSSRNDFNRGNRNNNRYSSSSDRSDGVFKNKDNNFNNRNFGGNRNNDFSNRPYKSRDNRFSHENSNRENSTSYSNNEKSNSFSPSKSYHERSQNRFSSRSNFSRNDRSNGFSKDRSSSRNFSRERFDLEKIDLELNKVIKEIAVNVLEEDGRPIPDRIFISKIIRKIKEDIKHQNRYFHDAEILFAINDLMKDGLVGKNPIGRYFLDYVDFPEIPDTKTVGIIQINQKGFAFVNTKNKDGENYSFYIHKKNINGAFHNDNVEIIQLDTSKRKSRSLQNSLDAKVIKILGHGKDTYVGIVMIDELNKLTVKCDNPSFPSLIQINNPIGLVDGHKVLIKITDFNSELPSGEIVRIVGHVNEVGVDILSIVLDNGIQPEFNIETQEEANKIDQNMDRFWQQVQQNIRKDNTNIPYVTIDPTTSKDFDDAIFIEKKDDYFLLSVAIADVASYLPLNSALNQAAIDRGTSVYLVNGVIPMLPLVLSNDLCSLNPNVERCAMVCDLKINFQGKVIWEETNVYPAIIKSHHRFNYDEVNEYFKKEKTLENVNSQITLMLDKAYELFFLMEETKKQKGVIDFNIPEAKIIVDKDNKPIEIKVYERWHAQLMIENFMIAANEGVTFFAQQKKLPFVYRVHDKPDEKNIEQFALEAKKLNFNITTPLNDLQPFSISKWLADNANNEYLEIINMMLLRAMAKAVYDNENLHHFGLASMHYTHFTSPIRRLPDILVHRIFWMYVFTPELYSEVERDLLKKELKSLCLHASLCEMRAVETERAVNSYKFAEYMQNYIGESFDGIVTNVRPKGFFVRLPNTVEGFVKIHNNDLDFFKFNDQSKTFHGENTGKNITIGTKVEVTLVNTNPSNKEIDFDLNKIIYSPY